MAYEVNFGTMRVAASKPAAKKLGPFSDCRAGRFFGARQQRQARHRARRSPPASR